MKKMRKRQGWLWLLVLLVVAAGLVLRPKKYRVMAVDTEGRLEINDGRKLELAEVRLGPVGGDKYEAAIFLMSELTKETAVWPERTRGGYRVWIGCRDLILGKDCRRGMVLNEVLLKAGVVTKAEK